MPILTSDATQRKIHTSSHGGMSVIEELLVLVRRPGLDVGKQHRGLFQAKCSTDLYVEGPHGLATLELKYSASSKICPRCKKVESDHLSSGCGYSGMLRVSHKNCGNRFRDAVGSITNQRNSDFARALDKPFTPHFLYVDLVDENGPADYHVDHMEYVRRAGGVVTVFTYVPGPAALGAVANLLCGSVELTATL